MKINKKNIKLIEILISIILIFLIFLAQPKNKSNNLYQDILFLKLFKATNEKENITKESKEKIKQYKFNVKYNNMNFKNINLIETINKKTLINEKIAPGVEGTFQIILDTNEDTNYFIEFKSENSKPKNLKFENVENKKLKNNIEELNSELKGKIKKDEQKIITIHWFWNYENSKIEDNQDTLDSKNIKNYKFTIHAYGKNII